MATDTSLARSFGYFVALYVGAFIGASIVTLIVGEPTIPIKNFVIALGG